MVNVDLSTVRIKCRYCGTWNNPDNTKCQSCGAPIELEDISKAVVQDDSIEADKLQNILNIELTDKTCGVFRILEYQTLECPYYQGVYGHLENYRPYYSTKCYKNIEKIADVIQNEMMHIRVSYNDLDVISENTLTWGGECGRSDGKVYLVVSSINSKQGVFYRAKIRAFSFYCEDYQMKNIIDTSKYIYRDRVLAFYTFCYRTIEELKTALEAFKYYDNDEKKALNLYRWAGNGHIYPHMEKQISLIDYVAELIEKPQEEQKGFWKTLLG
jgi:hypothetical protein